jgi:hypothetical protein
MLAKIQNGCVTQIKKLKFKFKITARVRHIR